MVSLVPRSFLFFIPLYVGAEVIIALGIFNKLSGFYGILSIFTGHPITAIEWILNLVSLALLPLYVMAFINISKKNALRMLVFAYVYAFDTLSSVGFTIFFSTHWFKVAKISKVNTGGSSLSPSMTESIASVTETLASVTEQVTSVASAAVTSVLTNVTAIKADGELAADIVRRETEAVLNKSASLPQETAVTILITVGLLMVRIYFTLVIIGYARLLVRQQNLRSHNGQPKGSLSAKLQYLAISVAEPFWTGNSWSSGSRSPSASTMEFKDEANTRLNADFDQLKE
jgi:hypothetical protein